MTSDRVRRWRVAAFVWLVAAMALVAFVTLLSAQPTLILPPRDDLLPFCLFAVLLFLGESQPKLSMRFGDHGEVTPGWAFAYALVLIGSPSAP